jgi:hypothetical protein
MQEIYGYTHLIPTHQGRAAEHMISQLLIKKGDVVPGNMYFTTTRLHQELAGGQFVDVIIDEAHDPERPAPVQGQRRPGQVPEGHRRARRRQDPLHLHRHRGEHVRRAADLAWRTSKKCRRARARTASSSCTT